MESYVNPIPVVLGILLVNHNNKVGVLVQQRAIPPKVGEWALTGGYMSDGESWQESLVREVREELGLETDPNKYVIYDVDHSTNKTQVLIAGFYTEVFSSLDKIPFIPNNEVTDIKVIWQPTELAFPVHTSLVKRVLLYDDL